MKEGKTNARLICNAGSIGIGDVLETQGSWRTRRAIVLDKKGRGMDSKLVCSVWTDTENLEKFRELRINYLRHSAWRKVQ
jgi:hypothetical protein